MLIQWPSLKSSGLLSSVFEYDQERLFRSKMIDLIAIGTLDSWAFLWAMTCMANNGLSALPNTNLVENVGFGEDATHTYSRPKSSCRVARLGELKHPSFVLRSKEADTYTYVNHFGGSVAPNPRGALLVRVLSSLKKTAKKIMHSIGFEWPTFFRI